jgi:hypothetical protein
MVALYSQILLNFLKSSGLFLKNNFSLSNLNHLIDTSPDPLFNALAVDL